MDRRMPVTAYCVQFGRLRLERKRPHRSRACGHREHPRQAGIAFLSGCFRRRGKTGRTPAAESSGPVEADGYSKIGPGPLQAIRFKWTVRRDDKGDYFVDETIGDNSVPISSGPMPKDAAIRFVDERESEARQRFEGIKREMAARDVSG